MNDDLTFTQTYRASELVSKLQELVSKHGDLPVVLNDPDTGWLMEIGVVFSEPNDGSDNPNRAGPAKFEITSEYSSERPPGHKQ